MELILYLEPDYLGCKYESQECFAVEDLVESITGIFILGHW